jgi:hypothetical protein
MLSLATRKVCEKMVWKKHVVEIFSKTFYEYLDAGYAMSITTYCPADFWRDGIDDGVVNFKDYPRDRNMGHAVYIRKKGSGIQIVNSWGDYEAQGKSNTYDCDLLDMFKDDLVKPYCFLVI